jgi:hypothetical protein
MGRQDRVWQGRALNAREFVISADEKSSIQARRREQPTLAPASGRSTRIEHEYFRKGAWSYLAVWDVHLNEGGGWPFSIGGLSRLGANGRLLRPDCRDYERSLTLLEHLPELSKQTGGQTIPTCNRELAIHGSVDSGNLFVGSGTPASLNAGSGTIEDVGMTPNFA